MLKNEVVLDELRKRVGRYDSLKSLFAQFQAHIQSVQAVGSPIRSITIEALSPTQSRVTFLGECFLLRFLMRKHLGLIEFWNEAEFSEDPLAEEPLAAVEFTGQGEVKIKQPDGEDPINLKEDTACICLLVNWLYQHGAA